MKKSENQAIILTGESEIGSRVKWRTIGGKQWEGELIEWDGNVAIIRLDVGSKMAVEVN
jgi:hypothetical protein